MKENFQIHIWLGLLLCLLGMSCSDDTPAKGDDPGNGNTELVFITIEQPKLIRNIRV